MRIAVYKANDLPQSSRIYLDNISAQLAAMGHDSIIFSDGGLPEPADLYWQPSVGRNGPNDVFRNAKAPVVVTFHGAANLVLPVGDCYGKGLRQMLRGYLARRETVRSWQRGRGLCSAIIAVSEYAKTEAVKYLRLPETQVTPIYHGVDHRVFSPANGRAAAEPYFLHVSSYQPKKNIERLIAAYRRLSEEKKPGLKIIASGYPEGGEQEGIELIRRSLAPEQLADLYRNAFGFIFPSLHETFGMPIIEAMACGCPVVTSNNTGCAEIAGEAAILVDPYSVDGLLAALKELIASPELRGQLKQKGLARAAGFTWLKSAEQHLSVFRGLRSNHDNHR